MLYATRTSPKMSTWGLLELGKGLLGMSADITEVCFRDFPGIELTSGQLVRDIAIMTQSVIDDVLREDNREERIKGVDEDWLNLKEFPFLLMNYCENGQSYVAINDMYFQAHNRLYEEHRGESRKTKWERLKMLVYLEMFRAGIGKSSITQLPCPFLGYELVTSASVDLILQPHFM